MTQPDKNQGFLHRLANGVIITALSSLILASAAFVASRFFDLDSVLIFALGKERATETAVAIISDNAKELVKYQEMIREIGLVFEDNILEEAVRQAEDRSEFWAELEQELIEKDLISSEIDHIVHAAFEWYSLRVPDIGLAHENAGGPLIKTLEGVQGPNGHFKAPNLSEYGYIFSLAHVIPSNGGEAVRISYFNESNERTLDILAVPYHGTVDALSSPVEYNSDKIEYFAKPSGNFVYITIGRELRETLSNIWQDFNEENR